MLILKDVYAGYGAGDVINGVSFTINPGENLSIIGPNGCGKSTLLKVMAGLLPYRGEIMLGGQPLHRASRRVISAKIAMLSQMPPLYFSYSVYDTVMMGRYVHNKSRWLGRPSDGDRKIVDDALKAVNLLHEKDKDITKLSGGQQQRVFLARTLAQQPEIILLDEPTNHLDLKHQIELIHYLKAWAKDGNRAIVGVLHDINQALNLSSNVLVMQNGKAAAHGENIVTETLLEKVYEVDVAAYMRQSLEIWRK
ncbi:MAG: ABC transporter ATP-binding protein [Defluviitaleaceae bacterium]|nr:ABC transporter ATP-binding protein [Defluviitaleaceae bacterium]